MLLRILYFVLPFALFIGCGGTPDTSATNPEHDAAQKNNADVDSSTNKSPNASEAIAERIESAIAMLEAEKYQDFLETFFVPEELKALKDGGRYEEVVKIFPDNNAPELLSALRSIRGTQPTMSEDQKTAWFTTDETIAGQNSVALVNIDGLWFIPNRPPER